MARSRELGVVIGFALCVGLLPSAWGQATAPQDKVRILRIEWAKLVGGNREPREFEVVASLQTTGGMTISRLSLFYRAADDQPFHEVKCLTSPDLTYSARIPYSPAAEYYFVATSLGGDAIRFGNSRVVGAELEPKAPNRNGGKGPYLVAAVVGVAAAIISVFTTAETPVPPSERGSSHNRAAVAVGIGAAAAGVSAGVIYLVRRHRKRTPEPQQKGPQPEAVPDSRR
jgi:hypothetical protein